MNFIYNKLNKEDLNTKKNLIESKSIVAETKMKILEILQVNCYTFDTFPKKT